MSRSRSGFAKGIDGRHVLLALVALFGVMFLVNGIFVYLAIATFSGGDTTRPYQRGLNYNRTLEADRLQAKLGWRIEPAYEVEVGRVVIKILNGDDGPVTGLRLNGKLGRPATDKEDRPLRFEEVSPGIYVADVDAPSGIWVLSMVAREKGEGRAALYRLKRRLFVAEKP